jgi:glycosyltransferase involved in cell wall biosynthesis
MTESKLNILFYGDVDMNLTDGSSIWLNSLVQVLARDPGIRVHVLLKARITKDLLLQDLVKLENVRLTDPFRQFAGFNFQNKNRLVPEDAVTLIGRLLDEQPYNCVIIRGMEACKKAVNSLKDPSLVIPYITGFTDDPVLIPAEEKQSLQAMYERVKLMFLQTDEMKRAFLEITGAQEDKIAVLPPMVPDFPSQEPAFRNCRNTIVYVGKFSNDYYLYESLTAFKELGEEGYRFEVAGDKFHTDLKVTKEELITMMETIPGVSWMKALNREEVSGLIANADLGLCWRSKSIDNERSMELSTKLLEYGRLGKPVLVRRIPIHERLLGAGYPFYVDTAEDFAAKTRLAFSDPVQYEKAARKVYEVSLGHSFSHVSLLLKPFLARFSQNTVGHAMSQPSGNSLISKIGQSFSKLFR